MKTKIIKNTLIFLSYFLYQILVLCVLQLLNIDMSKMSYIKKNIFLLSQDIIYFGSIIFIYKDELIEDLKDFKKNGSNLLIKYAPIYLLGVFLMGISNSILTNITGIELSSNEENIRILIKHFPIYMCFSSAIYAPVVEELIFRKSIRNIINDNVMFIIISGLVFGLIHVISTGNESLNEILMGIPYIIMGIDFAYIYFKSKNIFTTMVLHSVHNTILLIIQFIGG